MKEKPIRKLLLSISRNLNLGLKEEKQKNRWVPECLFKRISEGRKEESKEGRDQQTLEKFSLIA